MFQKAICSQCGSVSESADTQLCPQCATKLPRKNDHILTGVSSARPPTYMASLHPQIELNLGEFALYIVDAQKALKFKYLHPIILGHSQDAMAPDEIYIDLDGYDAYDLGVSRRHARIHYLEGGYSIEDLDSSNGTFINAKLMISNRPYMLKYGDHVTLGLLEFIFHCQ